MSWTDERIAQLKKLWEQGNTASQIAEELGGVSRNAVIGKAHRLGLQSRPSPVRPNETAAAPAPAAPPVIAEAPTAESAAPDPVVAAPPVEAAPAPLAPAPVAPPVAADIPFDVTPPPIVDAADDDDEEPVEAAPAPVIAPTPPPQPVIRSVGPGGFIRQSPGDSQPPATPAPPRRLVPARPSAEMAGKTSLLELNDRVCKWPLGHPGEPDFHFCGKNVNPGFPYCLDHCSVAYQAQLPRRDRRPPPPLPFGGPRVR